MSSIRESDRSILWSVLRGEDDLVLASRSEDGWRDLVIAARNEGVLPLVHRSLGRSGRLDSIPFGARRNLKRSALAAVAANDCYYRELARILRALDGTEVAVIKGAALASTLYPEPGLRPMADLDLLVRPERWTAAIETLGGLGYRPMIPELAAGWNEAMGHAIALRGGPWDRVLVDVHFGLVAGGSDWRSPPQRWVWDGMERFRPPSPLAGASGLSATVELLYLSAHLVLQHGEPESRLIWYHDLHLLAQVRRIDWDGLLRHARALRWTAALSIALHRCQKHLGTPLPDGLLAELDRLDDPVSRRIARSMMDPVPAIIAQARSQLRCLSWPARLRFVLRHVIPSPTYMRWRYRFRPAWLWPLGYPVRWLAIARMGVSTLVKRCRGRRG